MAGFSVNIKFCFSNQVQCLQIIFGFDFRHTAYLQTVMYIYD